MSYKCEILADSISPQGNRLTTFKVTYPRIIHAEMCRHRILSRNTASSRAIPFEKMVKDVQENPFIPISWQKTHKGMQGSEYFTEEDDIQGAIDEWLESRDGQIANAKQLNKQGVTKQLCNRLLEPFVWTTELVSGTEWDNFFSLRCPKYYFEPNKEYFKSKKDYAEAYKSYFDCDEMEGFYNDTEWLKINESQAEIHIQKIAEMMWDCYNESNPKTLQAGEWHIPYGDISMSILDQQELSFKFPNIKSKEDLKCRIATARAARISYTTLGDNPKIDYEADIKLHDRLLESKHLSCFEHCARVMNNEEYMSFIKGQIDIIELDEPNIGDFVAYNKVWNYDKEAGWCNNYRSFIQYRYLIENKND